MKGSSRKPLLSDWQLLVRITPLTAQTNEGDKEKEDMELYPQLIKTLVFVSTLEFKKF